MARAGHVYVMRCEENALKVGFSTKPERRSVELGKLEILYVSDWYDNADRIELAAHRLLKIAGQHIKGERFRASIDEAIRAIDEAVDIAATSDVGPLPCQRQKIPLNLAIRPDLVERMDRWLNNPLSPTKTAFVEWAIARALDEVEGKKDG